METLKSSREIARRNFPSALMYIRGPLFHLLDEDDINNIIIIPTHSQGMGGWYGNINMYIHSFAKTLLHTPC